MQQFSRGCTGNRTGGGIENCMMGHRIGGTVEVWSLNWRDLGPLEKPCTAQAALAAH